MSKLVLCLFLVAGCTTAPPAGPLACETPEDANAAADIVLTAADATITADDVTFVAWTYDGDVPGPVLRIGLGETRRVKLVNRSPRPVSLHFHGLTYSEADDGDPDHPTSIVNPGCAHVSTVTATQPGVWPYHSHHDARAELSRGLYGVVVVPEANEIPADHEFVIMLASLGIESTAAAPTGGDGDPGEGGTGPRSFFQVINGRPDGAAEVIELKNGQYVASKEGLATAKVGDRVRFRVANLSGDDAHTFHIHGHRWCDRGGIAGASGMCPGETLPVDNVDLFPATGFTAEFIEDNPGMWMVHCHILDHVTDGMYAFYDVEE